MLKRAFIALLLMVFALFLNAFLNPIPKKNIVEGFKPQYGVTYSFEQATWYGLDPRASYAELLDTVEFDWVRLPFFWDQMTQLRQGSDGQAGYVFNESFEDLKWAINEAGKRDVKVIVVLGAKVPYYPEYHLPEKIKEKIAFGDDIGRSHGIAGDLLAVDAEVVKQLSGFENIAYWQIENEPLLGNVNGWKVGTDLLAAEIEAVKGSDPVRRPIILNHVGPASFDKEYRKILSLLAPGDVLGANAYFKTQGTYLLSFKALNIPWPKWFYWPVQSWVLFSPDFEAIKEEVEAKGVKFWILEMQAEPYIRQIEDAAKPDFAFKPEDIEKADKYLRSSRVESIGLWGAHFWQYKAKNGDSRWIEAVKAIVN